MKKYLSRLLALALALCLCLGVVPMATAAAFADPPEPGPIDMSVEVTELASRNYRVTYTAGMNIIKDLAMVAVTFRDHDLMSQLRFTCILEDELVEQLTDVTKEDFVFDCAKWKGLNIFVFENASVTDDGLEIRYRLHDEVLDDWCKAETKIADIMEALTARMTMTASGIVSRAIMNELPKQMLTTGEVTLEGIGVQKVYGVYTITGAEGSCRWQPDDHIDGYRPGYDKDHDHACILKDCPRNIHCPAGHFVDLDLQLWYHDGIHFCAEHDLMIGMTGTTFEPYTAINRAMVVTILYRMEGKPAVTGRRVYDDVAPNAWYGAAVEWATDNKVVNGYGGGEFGPMDPITREQMAAILWRYAKYQGCDVSVGEDTNILSYNDAENVSEYAIPAMQWACGAKMIQGANGYLMPLDSTTRAQAAAIIQRYCMYVGW